MGCKLKGCQRLSREDMKETVYRAVHKGVVETVVNWRLCAPPKATETQKTKFKQKDVAS